MADHGWIRPQWPAPESVHAVSTTRSQGFSLPPYNELNLGAHVGDDIKLVLRNREYLSKALALPAEPLWLEQVHGVDVIDERGICGDARIVHRGEVAVVMTADCLPVLFCDQSGHQVAAAHAGWRGLEAGVLENTVARFNAAPDRILAWLGPAIGPDVFEVGEEVRDAFISHDVGAEAAFKPVRSGHWLADLYLLARQRLNTAGVTAIYGGGLCTFKDAERFFSFRRDRETGRMASLIWID
jgi:hypothetical protein